MIGLKPGHGIVQNEQLRLAWLADGDELRQAAGVWWLWRSVLCGAFVVAAVLSLLLLHDRA